MSLLPKNIHWQVAMTTISQKYDLPGLWYLDLWPIGPCQIVVTDPDVAFYLTVTRNHEKHIRLAQAVDPLIGEGNIVSAEGTQWKRMHKMLAPAFAITQVTNMRPMIAENVMEFRAIMSKLAETGEAFEFEKYIERLTFDIIGTATFGQSLGAQAKGSPVIQHWEAMARAIMQERAIYAIDFVRIYLVKRKLEAAKKKFSAEFTKLIRERLDYVQRNDVSLEKQNSSIIIDMVLREYLQKKPQSGSKGMDPEFLEAVLIQARTLIIGGTGTTSDTLCFIYMLLSAHPEVLQKLREEHVRMFAPSIEATYDILCSEPYKLNSLEYTTNVIKEALRLYPVGGTARKEHADGFLPYNGQKWSTKGFLIIPVQLAMHMDPKIFPNPKVFDPDRYTREDFVRNAWRPFEKGPRACLGQSLAMDEMKIMLLLTVRDFDFVCEGLKPNKTPRVPWSDMDLTFGDRAFQEFVFEAKPRDGMPMSVKKSNWS